MLLTKWSPVLDAKSLKQFNLFICTVHAPVRAENGVLFKSVGTHCKPVTCLQMDGEGFSRGRVSAFLENYIICSKLALYRKTKAKNPVIIYPGQLP